MYLPQSHSLGMFATEGGTARYAVRYLDGVPLLWRLLCGAVTGQAVRGIRQRYPQKELQEAITLAISITGLMCFWSGVMELLQASRTGPDCRAVPSDGTCSASACSEAHPQDKRGDGSGKRQCNGKFAGVIQRGNAVGICVRQSGCMYLSGRSGMRFGYRADADCAERNLNSADSVYGGGGSCGLRSTRAI